MHMQITQTYTGVNTRPRCDGYLAYVRKRWFTLALPAAPGALLLAHVCSGLHAGDRLRPCSLSLNALRFLLCLPLC